MSASAASAGSTRRHDPDALRGFAMLLGIGLHASLAMAPSFCPVQGRTTEIGKPYDEMFQSTHGFRMPLSFC